jgi:hypothetical protein
MRQMSRNCPRPLNFSLGFGARNRGASADVNAAYRAAGMIPPTADLRTLRSTILSATNCAQVEQ